MTFSRSPGEKPPVRASAAKRSRMGFLVEIRGMKKVIVDAAQITRMRNSRRWIIPLRLTVASFLLQIDWLAAARESRPPGASTESRDVLLRGLQLGDHQQSGLGPDGAIFASGQVILGRPVGPVGLVVGDAMQPLDDRDVDHVAPVDAQRLSGRI